MLRRPPLRWPAIAMTLVLVASGLAAAHLYNHQTRHEDCEIKDGPHGHAVDDGHAHWHHNEDVGAHLHDGQAHPAGHTHAFVAHDPCNQVGMQRPAFAAQPPLREVPLTAAAASGGPTVVVVQEEAYELNVAGLTETENLVVRGDADLAAFPGTGTPTDPYIIEGHLVRNVLLIKDTTACVVVRDNVVHSIALTGPLVDPDDVVDRRTVEADLRDLVARLQNRSDEAASAEQEAREEFRAWSEEAADRAQMRKAFEAQAAAHRAASRAAQEDHYQQAISALESRLQGLPAGGKAGLEARLADLRSEYEDVRAGTLDEAAAQQAFQRSYTAFQEADTRFQAGLQDQKDRVQGAVEAADQARAELQSAQDRLEALLLAMADGVLEHAGRSYDDLADVVRSTAADLQAQLDEDLAGRLVLDWNGQCIHVHHNVVEDLRVNRNNQRTGYATGGIIEDNRIDAIGQIRHYDGEFRENEVGDRAHLYALVPGDPDHTGMPEKERSLNNDGANQGWFHHNLIYGSVDLDFHGHHHGAGFFAPKSHYHGSDPQRGYMYQANGTPLTGPGGHHLSHHDHQKRWTSAVFEHNTVIDPLGYGVRWEDRGHAGDDRNANSEGMEELDRPHVHQTWVQLANNTIVGSLWTDVFNADGIELWDDDWSPVARDRLGRVLDAALHLGANIVDSHPQRNQGWLDIENNDVFLYDKEAPTKGAHYGWAAYQINNGKQVELLSVQDNRAFLLPQGMDPGHADAEILLQELQGARTKAADTVAGTVSSWGGNSSGHTTIGMLLRGMQDSRIEVCGTALRGFDVGLQARHEVYVDAAPNLCSGNDWGSASPATDIVLTPYPVQGPPLTSPLRGVTDPTVVRHVPEPVYEEIDRLEPVVDTAERTAQGVVGSI